MTYTGERIERTLLFGKRKRRNDPYAYHKSAKTPWGNPIVYILSLLLVLICVVPVLYIILGGFRTNSQITRDPAGMPNPWNFENYATVVSSTQKVLELTTVA